MLLQAAYSEDQILGEYSLSLFPTVSQSYSESERVMEKNTYQKSGSGGGIRVPETETVMLNQSYRDKVLRLQSRDVDGLSFPYYFPTMNNRG